MLAGDSVVNVIQQSTFSFQEGMKISCKILGFEDRSYSKIPTFI